MELEVGETQRLLADSVRKVLAGSAAVSALQACEASLAGFDDELWKTIVELGWTGLAIPSELGGGGGSLVDVGLVALEVGRAAVASPWRATVTAAIVAERLGQGEAVDQLLGAVVAGARLALVAAPWDGAAIGRQHRGQVSGGPWIVEWGGAADSLVMAVQDESGSDRLVVVPADALEIVALACSDNERTALVEARDCPSTDLAAGPVDRGALLDALGVASLLRAASMVGTAERSLELTVGHVANREQFGQPLGRFQVVQHKCADVAIHADVARLAVFHALSRAAAGLPAAADTAVAAYLASRAAEVAVIEGAQLHGGLGFMNEYELSFHFRRAKAYQLRDGGERWQLQRIAERTDELLASGWART